MRTTNFLAGREPELHNLIENPANRDLDHAACVGTDTDAYHPEDGRPDELTLFRCQVCPVRLACLALALRAEDPDARAGWYGGYGPAERDDIAAILHLETFPPQSDRAAEAARLRAEGRTVNDIAAQFGCSRRTVQRYLRTAAA